MKIEAKWWLAILGVLLLAVLWGAIHKPWDLVVGKHGQGSNTPPPAVSTPPGTAQPAASPVVSSPAAEAWTPPSPEPAYDHFLVYAGKGPEGKDLVTTIKCFGFTVTASPAPDLEYDIYINHRFFCHVPKKSNRPKDWRLDKDKPFPDRIYSVGYHLTAGQGYEELPFGCVMSFGDENQAEKDKQWFARAMTVEEAGG